jgi:phospholipid/cholesterol/gamma-HCH transport system substrate-binding protein
MNRLHADDRRTLIGGGLVVTFVAVLVLFLLGTIPTLLSGHKTMVRADFDSTGGLNVGEPVRVDGVTVGKVSHLAADGGGGTTVTMRLTGDVGTLYSNARASIRWRTVLGGAFAVELDRGTASLPELGTDVIPKSRTANQVELDEVTGALRARERAGIKTTLHELPDALADPAEPGHLLAEVGQHGKPIAEGLDALRGEQPDTDLARLVRNTGAAVTALDAPQQRLRTLVQGAAITTGVTAARARELGRSVSILNAIQPGLRSGLADIEATLVRANPLVRALTGPAGDVAPTLAVLRPVVGRATSLLRAQAEPLLRSLRPTARALSRTARLGVPVLDALIPSLRRIDDQILPQLAKVSPESRRSTYEMLGPAVAGLEGAAAHYDAQGHYVRLLGTVGGHVYDGLPCQVSLTDPTSTAYIQCLSVSKTLGAIFGGRR